MSLVITTPGAGLIEADPAHWREEPNPSSHQQSACQRTSFYGDRPIMQTLSGLIFLR